MFGVVEAAPLFKAAGVLVYESYIREKQNDIACDSLSYCDRNIVRRTRR
jgi:hypothetical protein